MHVLNESIRASNNIIGNIILCVLMLNLLDSSHNNNNRGRIIEK